jgi:hypothetical protein
MSEQGHVERKEKHRSPKYSMRTLRREHEEVEGAMKQHRDQFQDIAVGIGTDKYV